MTINDVITEVDNQKPNQYTDEEKIRWISVVEKQMVDTIFNTHEGEEITFTGYSIGDIGAELLVEDAYADVYKYYLYSMIDAMNGELSRYQGSMALYNSALKTFGDYYNRNHMHKSRPMKIF